jgi:hypothetical protein
MVAGKGLTAGGRFDCVPYNERDIGMPDEQVQPRDILCVVLGCTGLLFILRFGEVFQILGQSYIQGFMYGEAVSYATKEELLFQDLIFCWAADADNLCSS